VARLNVIEPLEPRVMLTVTFTTVASFDSVDGSAPEAPLLLSGTTLYGTTFEGGPSDAGVVFSVQTTDVNATPDMLGSFDRTDGDEPSEGRLVLSGSTLYGTAQFGGTGSLNQGVVYSLPTSGGTPTVLYSFDDTDTNGGPGTDASIPQSGLILDGSSLIGTSDAGGLDNPPQGSVYSEPISGGPDTVLASFTETDSGGINPQAGVALSGDGTTLYGVTSQGGVSNQGMVFSVPVGGGSPSVLAAFAGTNGAEPNTDLILSNGVLYGTADSRGMYNKGVVFSVPASGGAITVLAAFDGADGESPEGALLLSGGVLYGTTESGGANSLGEVFSVPITAVNATPNVIYSFSNAVGTDPMGGLVADGSGNLYGTTIFGGAGGHGIVYQLSGAMTPAPTPLVINGTTGADTITLQSDGTNVTYTVNGTTSSPIPISQISSIAVNGLAAADSITVESSMPSSLGVSVLGGGGPDTITGGTGPDTLGGAGGSDSITAGTGNDSISGGNGNDVLLGVSGDDGASDTIVGGAGDDFINGGSASNSFLAGGLNSDTIIGGTGSNNTLKGGKGADVLATGNEDLLTLTGDTAAATVATSDALFGGKGRDTLIGSIGADSLTGGNGADVLVINNVTDVVEDFTPAQGDVQPYQDTYPTAAPLVVDFDVTLKIIVNGTTVMIPSDAGSFMGVVSAAQVTSVAGDGTATVNFSYPGARNFVLGDFFNQWGITFNGRGIAQYSGLGPGASVAMTVNGAANTDFAAYEVQSGDSIVITVTDPSA
jgi:uncharacterized repeat protein (TIGR03803 family)